jgi:hypothetical protein
VNLALADRALCRKNVIRRKMTPHLPLISRFFALLLGYLQGTTVSNFGEHAVMLTSILGGSSSYQQSKPPASEPAQATEENQNDAQQAETQTASNGQTTQNSAAAQEASKPQSVQAPTKTEAVQAVAQAKPTEMAPKATTADNEAFARAAAQRSVDSQRTRALLDTIAPVNNSAVEAAKSYVSKVEPDAPEATASKATAAAKPALDKAA